MFSGYLLVTNAPAGTHTHMNRVKGRAGMLVFVHVEMQGVGKDRPGSGSKQTGCWVMRSSNSLKKISGCS